MGRLKTSLPQLKNDAIARFFQQRFGTCSELQLRPLKEEANEQQRHKGYGYGQPLLATFRVGAIEKNVVLRTMSADPFGHDRRADRVADMVLSSDTFSQIPKHIKPLTFGVVNGQTGELTAVEPGEPFLITEYVDGSLYAAELLRTSRQESADDIDKERAVALADYLSDLHSEHGSEDAYRRHVRDLVGSGEGFFGLADAYASTDTVATPQRLQTMEALMVKWRWRLSRQTHRSRRIHGDFHPFNILFRKATDFSVLDASRGCIGDPADDVSCLSINYIFFGMLCHQNGAPSCWQLWDAFWRQYLTRSNDEELLLHIAPYFAWRCLVLACPLWYPKIPTVVRHRILNFAERLLRGSRFSPLDRSCMKVLL